jgi:hypothetical protein
MFECDVVSRDIVFRGDDDVVEPFTFSVYIAFMSILLFLLVHFRFGLGVII